LATRPRRRTVKALRLAFWKANGVRDTRIELDHFFAQHGIDVCLLNETHLDPGQAFRFANYVCHRTHRSTKGGGTAVLVRQGIEHHALPVPGLRHLEASGIELKLAGKPTMILAVYLSPCRPLIKSDLTACLSGGLPVLMAGVLNVKHVDWNSWLTTVRGKLLRDYADRHSCLIHGPDSNITVPYNPSVTPDVLDIAVTKNLPTPVQITACSALSSDHLHILIDTRCRSSFLNMPDRSHFKRTDWPTFQACLNNNIPFNPETADEAGIDTCVESLTSAIGGALEASAPKSQPRADPRLPIPAP
jgi:hypothetical protein